MKIFSVYWDSQVPLAVENLPANAGDVGDARRSPWVGKVPWRREWQPTPVFLPGASLGQRSLVGYSAWGRRGQQDCSDPAHTPKGPLHGLSSETQSTSVRRDYEV